MEVVRIGEEEPPWQANLQAPVDDPDPVSGLANVWPLYLVTWRDAWFDFDQPDEDEEERSDYIVTTVGFLVRQGPRFLSIAQELLPDGDGFRAVTHIPLSVVVTMSPLQGPETTELNGRAAP